MKRKYADFLGHPTSTTSPAAGHKPNVKSSGSAAPTTRLCVKCLNYNFSRETLDPDYQPSLTHLDPKPAVFATYGKLVASSATCPLCKLVLEGLERTLARGTQQSLSKYGVGKNSKVFAFMLTMQSEGEATIGFFIIPPEEERLQHRILQAPRIAESYLRVYADKSQAKVHRTVLPGRWARNPPLTPWSEPCLDRLKGWLNACLGKHGPECCTTLSGERIDELLPPVLPTRIIDVGPREGSGSARLVESQGERGHYTALSYCWGSSRKSDRPYLTTTETLEKHLSELPWDLLPKTLRDAILLTRAVGMRYLWVDSLCIIQDSNDDWEKEAARMGTLYAQARLVIAATIGTDAQAGLFPFQTYIHHPSRRRIASWRRSPSLYFRNLPNERGSPQLNLPLFTRGWATQEWVLARRIVFWTQERMCWYCANECVGDDGNSVSTYAGLFQRYTTWKEIATLYSGRDLTYPTDKLIALSGIANEIQKQRPKDKYVFGSWQSNLPHELVWSGQAGTPTASGREELHIPSWSWVAHRGAVRFLDQFQQSAQSSISILGEFSLQIVARFKRVDIYEPEMRDWCLNWVRLDNGKYSFDYPGYGVPAWDILSICSKEVGSGSVQVARHDKRIWGVFDTPDFLGTYQKEGVGVGTSAGSPDEFSLVEIVFNEARLYGVVGLLLRKSPHTAGRYFRVGLGFAYNEWFEDAEVGEFIVD